MSNSLKISLHQYIYGEDPASQNDFHGIVINELPEPELDNQTPLPLLRDIYALNNTSFDKILDFHTCIIEEMSIFSQTEECILSLQLSL